MKCPICHKALKPEQIICQGCAVRLRQRIADLPSLHTEAHYCLQPQRGGHGTNSGEMTIGVNLHALDFVAGNQIFGVLHNWERVIREERQLTPVALLPKLPTVEAEVAWTVAFHLSHLDWTLEQLWVDEFAREVAELHTIGMTAARRYLDPVKRIPCPADLPDDEGVCGAFVAVKGDDLLEPVICKRCKTSWTPARLVAVALSDPSTHIWLDIEAISQWVGISERQARRIIATHKLQRKGQLIELQAFIEAKSIA